MALAGVARPTTHVDPRTPFANASGLLQPSCAEREVFVTKSAPTFLPLPCKHL